MDEAGNPLIVEEHDLPNLLNLLYSQMNTEEEAVDETGGDAARYQMPMEQTQQLPMYQDYVHQPLNGFIQLQPNSFSQQQQFMALTIPDQNIMYQQQQNPLMMQATTQYVQNQGSYSSMPIFS